MTTVARMLVDLTDDEPADVLANLIHEARIPEHLQPRGDATPAMARANGRHNLGVLEEALRMHAAGSAGTRSRLERRFRRLVRGAGLPEPVQNTHVNGFEVDAYWPGLCVEIDGPNHTAAAHPGRRPHPRRRAARRPGTASCASPRTTSTCAREKVLAQLATEQLAGSVAG